MIYNYREFEALSKYKKDLISFFENLAFFNSIDSIIDKNILKFLGENIYIPKFKEEIKNGTLFLSGFLYDNELFKKELINFLNALGITVVDVKFQEIKIKRPRKSRYPDSFLSKLDDADKIALVTRRECKNEEMIKLFYKGDYKKELENKEIIYFKLEALKYKDCEISINEESSGTKRILMILYYLINFLLKDNCSSAFVIDEMDAGLHDTLAREIINQYFDICHRYGIVSQLIITSHNTVLLKDIPLRKDQLWFTDMKEDRTTDLFSLAEIRGVKSSEDFAENYLRGKYGALPHVKEWIRDSEDDNE